MEEEDRVVKTQQQQQQQQHDMNDTTTAFRSILPHEPLSTEVIAVVHENTDGEQQQQEEEEEYGYLHIQGAITPKITTNTSSSEQVNTSNNDTNASATPTPTPTTPTTTTTSASNSYANITTDSTTDSDFWIQHRTAFETLLLLLFQSLPSNNNNHSCRPSQKQQQHQPHQQQPKQRQLEPIAVQLLDTIPPYTKVRCQYSTLAAAHWYHTYYSQHNITFKQLLFLMQSSSSHQSTFDESSILLMLNHHHHHHHTISSNTDNNTDNNNDNHDNRGRHLMNEQQQQQIAAAMSLRTKLLQDFQQGTIHIPDRLLQITEITNRPFLYNCNHMNSSSISSGSGRSSSNHKKSDSEKTTMSTITNHHPKTHDNNSCWTKSNPPKFRRLIARPYENIQYIEQQRASSRFVVITNLLPTTTISTTTATTDHQSNSIPQQQQEYTNGTSNNTLHTVWEEDPIAIAYAVRSIFDAYDTSGYGIEVFVPNQKNKRTRYCHIGMRSALDAQNVVQSLQESIVEWIWIGSKPTGTTSSDDDSKSIYTIPSGKLFLDYAAITQRSMTSKPSTNGSSTRDTTTEILPLIEGIDPSSLLLGHPSRPQCTSTTDDVHIPGLVLIPNYISTIEEEVLMAILTGPQAPWAPSQRTASYEDGIVRRMVQHYGYVFDYETADVLRDRTIATAAHCPPMPAMTTTTTIPIVPKTENENNSILDKYIDQCIMEGRGWEVLAAIIERTRQYQFPLDSDEDGVVTQSFPYINQLTINHYKPGEGIGSHVDTPSAFADGLISISLNSGIVMEFRNVKNNKQKKLVYLPPRSMLLMSKDARYEWEHHIVTRMTDTYNGIVVPRKLRVSLTLRTALTEDGTSHLPLVESSQYPPRWGSTSTNDDALGPIVSNKEYAHTPDCERNHVHKVYDAIATQWHHTRGKRGVLWPGATEFLKRLAPGSIVADVGCGDGKYFPAIWEAGSFVIGSDISEPLLRTAMQDVVDNETIPENCRVSDHRQHLRKYPAVIVADCMSVPLRTSSCDAAICVAVLHHLSTVARRKRCIEELVRIVKPGGMVNVQAWALEQEDSSRRKFASNDVFVPFNAQPKYLMLNGNHVENKVSEPIKEKTVPNVKSTAQVYSEALNAEYDEGKGLVVFQRYCHLYRLGELEEIAASVQGVVLLDSGFESGNYFIIFQVEKHS